MRHALVLGAVSAMLAAVPAAATAATPWVGLQSVTTTVPSAGYPGGGPLAPPNPAFAVNPSGRAVAAWASSDFGISVSRRASNGTWTAPQTISPAGKGGGLNRGIAVGIDNAGDATVAWSSAAGGAGEVLSATSTAGGTFATAVSVKTGVSPSSVDLAMSPSGEAVLVFDGASSTDPVYATTAATPGATWSAPVVISDGTANHGGYAPKVAINASGRAIATWTDTMNGSATRVLGRVRKSGAAWPSGAGLPPEEDVATVEFTAVASGVTPVIDDGGQITILLRVGSEVRTVTRPPANQNFTASDTVASNCNGGSDSGGAIALAPNGARTIAYACGGAVRTAERAAGVSFGGAGPGAQSIGALAQVPRLHLDVNASGAAVLLVGQTRTAAYRRAAAGGLFGAAEALVEPDVDLMAEGIGIDTAGNAVALLGISRTGEVGGSPANVIDQRSAILDVTAPTASVGGPATALVGDVLTFTGTVNDAFGGLVGTPAWTVTDGSAGSGASFVHTFAGPGTYTVTLTQADISGKIATATKTVTITERPAVTPVPSPTPVPGSDSTSTPTPTPTPVPGGGGTPGPGGGGGTGPVSGSSATVTAAALASTSFKALKTTKGKKSGGTTIAITLSAAATVQGKIELKSPGVSKQSGGKTSCAAPPKKKVKGQKPCTRLVLKGTLQFGALPAGTSPAVAFTGLIGKTRLAAGKYQLTVSIPGGTGAGKVVDFTIKK